MTPCCAEVLGYLSKQLLLSAISGEFYTYNEDYQMFVKTSTFLQHAPMYTGNECIYFQIYCSLLIEFILISRLFSSFLNIILCEGSLRQQ